eukprot:CAMPEP_0116947240 /NCGR_PEP_ID=MMETSP0467-20121206/37533_1 /TAXON_ID=283647 /ORGANISM="Mesodinium pulex, Strain SPMC105" /LENGTH=94 /DNA_ID=CAMNT_0004631311 /DNA_START=475 /DNA_END=759 /DNA_ORIENTATION=+
MTIERTLPYYFDQIVPDMINGKQVIVVAHGNSLRGLVKHFKKHNDEDIVNVNIPTAIPQVFYFDKDFNCVDNKYLATEEEFKDYVETQSKNQKL